MSGGSRDQRRAERKRLEYTTMVVDAIRDEPFGEVGNLSATGMLLISKHAPRSEAIYQLRLALPGPGNRREQIEVGVQEQWQEPPAETGLVWAGYRIVAIGERDAERLDAWLAGSV